MKLAEALLRRKELQDRLKRIDPVRHADVFTTKVSRIKVTDSIDNITADVPKLELNQVMAEYDHYARQLRLIDAAIQQANWTTELSVQGVMDDYKTPDRAA
jgi:hypothetical protein